MRLGMHYQLVREIDEGSFAWVWEAIDTRRGTSVALKIFRHRPHDQPDALRRFRLGGEAQERLSHRGIVRVFEGGPRSDRGYEFLVLELMDSDLRRWLTRTDPPDLDQRLSAVKEAAEALEYAHGQGVFHRDCKPSNILLDSDAHPKLSDFDLALVLREARREQGRRSRRDVRLHRPGAARPQRGRRRGRAPAGGCSRRRLLPRQDPARRAPLRAARPGEPRRGSARGARSFTRARARGRGGDTP